MSSTARRVVWTLVLALLLGAALVVTALAALTWGPNLARDRIARELGALLGREITIESIESRPWAGQFGLPGFHMAGPSTAGHPGAAAGGAGGGRRPVGGPVGRKQGGGGTGPSGAGPMGRRGGAARRGREAGQGGAGTLAVICLWTASGR